MPGILAERIAKLLRVLKWMLSGTKDRRPDLLGELLGLYGVELIFDIGANTGQSAEYFRQLASHTRLFHSNRLHFSMKNCSAGQQKIHAGPRETSRSGTNRGKWKSISPADMPVQARYLR